MSRIPIKFIVFAFLSIHSFLIKAQIFVEESTSIPGIAGSTAWGDYNKDGNIDFITVGGNSTTRTSSIFKNNGDNTFSHQSTISLNGVSSSSVMWGDYNNDGQLDILMSGYTGNGYFSAIYKNNANNSFTEQTQIPLQDMSDGTSIFGDYDNDGYSDILMTGYDGFPQTKLYRNNKGVFTEQTAVSFNQISDSNAAWGDYDNDGNPDFILIGGWGGDLTSKIYKNNGNNTFTKQDNINITGVTEGFAAWGDYNNDGYLDLIVTGKNNDNYISEIYKNNGDGSFSLLPIALQGVAYSSAAWGDYDNDGDLDLLISGVKSNDFSDITTKLYKNNNDDTFSEITDVSLQPVGFSSVHFIDYNNDSKLDISVCGYDGTEHFTRLYKNVLGVSNTAPSTTTNLTSQFTGINGNDITFKWDRATDTETPQNGLSYNLYVYKDGESGFIKSPDAFTQTDPKNGIRLIAKIGDIQYNSSGYTLKNLEPGNYKWSVQAIDGALSGGSFAPEQSITLVAVDPASELALASTSTSIICSWKRGDGDKCIVFARENGSGTSTPENNITYTGNAVFGSGNQIYTSGWYCVYNGTNENITVTGLKPLTNYAFHVIEYSGSAGTEQYSTIDEPTAHGIQTTDLFTEQTAISLTSAYAGSATWGDYDNDGDLDFLLTGDSGSGRISKIYQNNGDNTFAEQTGISLTGVSVSSVAWGDYDNDGDLDILIVGYTGSQRVAKVYRNNANNTFTEQTGISLTGVSSCDVSWADYDNDGDLDILLTGFTVSANISKIYRNNGDNTFTEQTGISLAGVHDSSIAWGDYDNDGDLDILLTGYTGSARIAKIYKNNGNNSFTEQTGISLTGVAPGAVAWGDYDNDGDLDILLTGFTGSDRISKIYRNNGNNTFTQQTDIVLTGVYYGSAIWGDCDNDGDLDILLAGDTGSKRVTKIYLNNGNNNFKEQTSIKLVGAYYISANWGDYDNDGDLDILLSGDTGSGYISKIYRNDILTPNTVPVAPDGLTSTIGTDIVLKWNPVTTDATPDKSMTYNVRIGKTSGASDVLSPMANNTSFRQIVAMGNAQQNTSFTIKNLEKGTYYWSVQAIDNSFAGSAFAPEQTFTNSEDDQASTLTYIAKSETSVECSWIRGNGDKCILLASEKGTGTAVPENNTTYTGNKAFGSGSQIGSSGWYCVYNGSLDSATITNLKPNTEYRFQVIEYTGNAGAEVYYTTSGTGNPAQYAPPFTEQTQIMLTGVSGSTQAWGDYDNDGDLDLIIAGNNGSEQIVELNTNNGDNTFSKSEATFELDIVYDVAWGDYDNDNDLDLLVASSVNSKVFENRGDGTFAAKVSLPEVFTGKCQWADLNNDGFKDIVLTGSGGTLVFKNNHDGTFTEQTTALPAVSGYSSVASGDYDNDGDLDLLLAGLNGSSEVTLVFKNDGNFIFTEQTGIVLPGISNCAVAWSDMDNDGDLDIVLSGGDLYTKIYDNNGNNTFTEIAGTPFKGLYRSAMAIADYNNDGYRDLVVAGSVNGDDYYCLVYRNNGNKTYSQSTILTFPGIQYGSIAWGDYDNDNDPDLFLCGNSSSGEISKVFKNNGVVANEKPNPLNSSIYISLNGNDVTFKWNKTSDDRTSSNGLSYNLYVYETINSKYGKSSEAFPLSSPMSGRKLVAGIGDIQYSSAGYTLKGLPAGNYKCSMQAIDAGLLSSAFTVEFSFRIFDLSLVKINVADSVINNTRWGMQYSFNSTNGIDGTWNNCQDAKTFCNFNSGGYDVWVRQTGNTNNKVKVGSIAAQADAPSYTINYHTISTVENVPETVEYSTSSSMTSKVLTGDGHPAAVTPGKTYYFRVKATATTLSSAVQTLVIPARPAVSNFTIDYLSEKTAEMVPSTIEYSTSSDMSNASIGTGEAVSIVPGQPVYFRTKGSASEFCSDIQTITPPARPASPAFAIDYINESTSQSVSSVFEYSVNENMSNPGAGEGNKVTIVPGQNLYIWVKSTATTFRSDIQTLVSPSRPATPSIGIDYINETTDQVLSSAYEYSANQDMSSPTTAGTKLQLVPGKNLYIRKKSTLVSFKSDIQNLIVPARPEAPTNLDIDDVANTFDWTNTPDYNEVLDYEYSVNFGITWTTCSVKPAGLGRSDVAAGSLKIRVKASDNHFKGVTLISSKAYTTGITSLNEAGIIMFPNPAEDVLNLENLPEQSWISIYNMNGKLLKNEYFEERNIEISVSDLTPGLYFIKVKTQKGESQAKFSKL